MDINIKSWIHINFWFYKSNAQHRKNFYLNDKELEFFKKILKTIIEKFEPYIFRKFYLFEPNPHCFLAIETNAPKRFKRYKLFNKNRLIKRATIKANSKDENNGEKYLNVLNATTDLILSSNKKAPFWLKSFPQSQRLPAHIIHCFLNQLTNSRKLELKFYANMIDKYLEGLKE